MGDHCAYIGAMHCPSSGGKNGNAQFLSCVHGKWSKVDSFSGKGICLIYVVFVLEFELYSLICWGIYEGT